MHKAIEDVLCKSLLKNHMEKAHGIFSTCGWMASGEMMHSGMIFSLRFREANCGRKMALRRQKGT